MIIRLLLFYLVFLYLLSPLSYCLPCSYKNPSVEDILYEVPIEDESSRLSKRSIGEKEEKIEKYEALRIHLYYDISVLQLPIEKQLYVNSSLLPEASGYWENILRVQPLHQPIKLRRKCISSYYYFRNEKNNIACDKGCREETLCGDAIIPNKHLLDCSYCIGSNDCYSTGNAGEGISDADFILYVTAVQTKRCENKDTLAYAAHCQQEAKLDRPIAGHVNLCPLALSTHIHDQEILVSTVKHEILHALGFSVGLYAFFRDENGQPRTRRNKHGKPILLNKEMGYYEWDKNTIDTILRYDWWTGDGKVVHPIQMMVTPRVKEEVQRHFGCDQLEGAELENQGGDGTILTHWEKRLFENEAMTGTHTQNPVYSRLTLALMEDTGWYKPNYEIAESLHWGNGLGCEFAMKSCGEWIRNKQKEGLMPFPFCDEIKHDGRKSLAVTRCTAQRDSLALCNLVPYKKQLPQQFRNFYQIDGISTDGISHYGGSVELADFCPYSQEFEWKITNSTARRDSRCELEGNNRDGEDILEVYGSSSRCFDFQSPWTERKCGRMRSLNHYMAGCYEYSCINGILFLSTYNSTKLYPCYNEGQYIHIKRITNGWLREGMIVCPACNELCSHCNQSIQIDSYIGDDQLDEPCSSPHSLSFIFIFILFIFLK